ncbi:type VI secretion system-associated FHA domain protein [Paraburkholderia lycopersici]|uniref:FHA domain protein n=1 Tax=Paraburkholderia lycopersici TaxID=416944 RepID=A0A1G6XT64_9BURK|nr:type VI secretion system-associated FHA domain protein [Paraburkholderia lycopersici]SDD81212.1 hypothetical protein SAMN05421548_1266 [Paraburkholderia lycopersici]
MSHIVDHVPGLRCEIMKGMSAGGDREAGPARHCDFTFPGGTLGRGKDNDLVLPDERQQIASLQAIVLINGSGQCEISNRGGMPIRLNGASIERGQQRPIGPGDHLEIGTYLLRFDELAKPDAPHADTAATTDSASENEHNEVPGEIWAALDAEFSAVEAQPAAQPASGQPHPLLQANIAGNRPDNPLILGGGETALLQEDDDLSLSWLFADDDPLMQMPIMADMTPTVLTDVSHRTSSATMSRRAPLVLDKRDCAGHRGGFALFEEAVPLETDFNDAGDTTLCVSPGAAAPLASAIDDLLAPKGNAAAAQTSVRAELPASSIDNARVTELPPLSGLVDKPLHRHTDAAMLTFPDPPERREPTIGRLSRPAPQTFSYAHATPDGRPLPDASATHQTNDRETDTSLAPVLTRALLDGMGLDHVQAASVGCDELQRVGRLLRMFTDHTMRLSTTDATATGNMPQRNAPDRACAHNPFYALPSGGHVLTMLFAQPDPDLMHIETAAAQALTDLKSGRNAAEDRLRPDDRANVDTVLHQLAPEKLERELAESGMRLLSLRTGKAALWDHFVCAYLRVAAQVGSGISHETAPCPPTPPTPQITAHTGKNEDAVDLEALDALEAREGAIAHATGHGSTSVGQGPAYGQHWGYW